jgi:DNA-binding transcriptional ArsR family regulator
MSTVAVKKKREARLDAVFHALADGTRRRLVDRLSRGACSVGELAAPFPISLAAISKHLDVLEEAGVVRRERDGRFQRCSLEPSALEDARDFIDRYRAFWEGTLDELAAFVERPRRKR